MNQPQEIVLQPCPTIDVARVQQGDSLQTSSALQEGADLFLKNGFLVLRNAFDPAFIETLRAEFFADYSHYTQDKHFSDALKVGEKRTMITVRVAGAFNAPELYANPRIFPLLKYLLSDEMILGSMGAVCSLPGAPWQHIHRDHSNIFDTKDVYPGGDQCIPLLPPYAITVVVPLVPLTELTGTTRTWAGSHRLPMHQGMDGPRAEPMTIPGDCYFMDYRLMHRGTPNRSSIVRPILYNVYYRPWFRDYKNYPLQTALSVSAAERDKIPLVYRSLFDWSFVKSNAN